MKEYIEREAAMDFNFSITVPQDKKIQVRDAVHNTVKAIAAYIEAIPAADVEEVQDALAFSQTFNLDEYRGKEDQRDCDFVFGVLMRLGIVCLKRYDPITRTMKLWVEKADGGADDGT